MIKEILDQTEHQLQEQVELVRLDILNIFENQLEVRKIMFIIKNNCISQR